MRISQPAPYLIAAAVLALSPGRSPAQGPPVPVEHAGPVPTTTATHCLMGSTAVRATTGGILGGWIGFVAAKIKVSDWNDASRSASVNRMRNQMTIGGAVLGAIGASLIHVNKSCASSVASGAPVVPRAGRQPITADEITHAGVNGSVYDVVYTLRRNWLNTRGLNSGTEGLHAETSNDASVVVDGTPQLVVYLDNVKLGNLEELRRLPVSGVTSIKYYEPAEANYYWGTGHTHGAIQVMTVERR